MSPTRVLAWLALAVSFAPRAHAQPVPEPFSLPRVGDVIDPEERRYFGLFPDYEGGAPLRLERAGPDSVHVVAVGGGGAYRARFSADQAASLADLVSRYESLFLAEDPAFEAPGVAGLVEWRRPFQDPGAPVTVTRRSGPDVRGLVVHVDEGGLVLSARPPPFRDFRGVDGLVWVPAADVLRARRDGFFSRLDLRPSGDPDRYVRGALPVLEREAAFVRGLSPELAAWRRARSDADGPDVGGPGGLPPVRDYARLPLSRWRVAVQYARGALDAGSTTARLFGLGGTSTNAWRGPTVSARGRLDYAVTPALGVGVAVERAGTEGISGVGLDTRRFSALAVDLTASFAVVPPQLRAPLLPSVTVRAGGSVARTASETTLAYYWPSRDYTATAAFSDRSVEVGGVVGVEAAFRLSRGASVTFGYDAAVYPWAEEGAMELDDPRVNLVVKTVEARSFDLRRGGATVGFAVHFGGP